MALKHCPSCGGRPDLRKKGKKFYYECGGCWTQTEKHETPEEAAEEWNQLKPEEKSTGVLKDCPWCKAEYTIIDDDFGQPVHPNMVKFCWHCGKPLTKEAQKELAERLRG